MAFRLVETRRQAELVEGAFCIATLVQGAFNSSKISGVDTTFGLLVRVLPGLNKQREAKKCLILS